MNKVTRGERILSKLANDGVISVCGKDWLTAALDPMHDAQLSALEGWPDVETAPSVIRQIKQTVSITAPTGLTGSTWDCHIVQWPWLNAMVFANPSVRTGNYLSSNTAPTVNTNIYGGVQAFATDPATNPAFMMGAATGVQAAPLATVDLSDPLYTQGATRLVGMGWEVTNTTAEIYKQGSVVPYRLPEPRVQPQYFGVVGIGSTTSQLLRPPPQTTASAMLIAGGRQWAAKDGCYTVVPFIGQDNPPESVGYVSPSVIQNEAAEDIVQQTSINLASQLAVNTSVVMHPLACNNGAGITSDPASKMYPIHQTGAIFTGLSLQTTLQLTVNMYLESFPGLAEKSILVLAKPSCQYDPRALAIFSECLRTLPVSVPAGMNGLGDWFADAVLVASEYIAPIAKTLGFNTVSDVARVAGRAANNYLASSSAVDKPKGGQAMYAARKTKTKKTKAKVRAAGTRKQLPPIPSKK
jgi:hypothetical protein